MNMSDEKTEKVAGQVPGVMQAAAQHLRKMAADNVTLYKRAESAENEVRRMKLARRMEQRGIEPQLSFEEKVEKLSALDPEKLATTEQAVELAAGGVRLGTVASRDEEKRSSVRGETYRSSEDGSDPLDAFVMNQEAYGHGG
jgi:hypothetical protein